MRSWPRPARWKAPGRSSLRESGPAHVLRHPLLAIALVLSAGVAPAAAADVSFSGGGLTITGAPGEGSRLTVQADTNVRATVHDDADGLRPGPGCIGTARQVVCAQL